MSRPSWCVSLDREDRINEDTKGRIIFLHFFILEHNHFLLEIPDQVFKILCELDCFSVGRNYYFLSNTFF